MKEKLSINGDTGWVDRYFFLLTWTIISIYILFYQWISQDGPALLSVSKFYGEIPEAFKGLLEYKVGWMPSLGGVWAMSSCNYLVGDLYAERLLAWIILTVTASGLYFSVKEDPKKTAWMLPFLLLQTFGKGFYNFHLSMACIIWIVVMIKQVSPGIIRDCFISLIFLIALTCHPMPVVFGVGYAAWIQLRQKQLKSLWIGIPAIIILMGWMLQNKGAVYHLRSWKHGVLEWITMDFLRLDTAQTILAMLWGVLFVIYFVYSFWNMKNKLGLIFLFLLFLAFWLQPEETMGGGLLGIRLQWMICLTVIWESDIKWPAIRTLAGGIGLILVLVGLTHIPSRETLDRIQPFHHKIFSTSYKVPEGSRIGWHRHAGEYVSIQGEFLCRSNHFMESGYYPVQYSEGAISDTLIELKIGFP